MNAVNYPALGEQLYDAVLPNGLRVIVVRKTGFQKSHAIFATRYGGADRRFRLGGAWIDTPPGVAHFLEHKMFDMPDGTNVLAELSGRGAAPNAFTGSGMTGYHFTCTDNFYENLRTLLTYVSTPYFTEASVAKEQGIIGQEIRMYENAPGMRGYYGLLRALYARHPLRDPVVGTVESIALITPEILYNCHRVFYNPSNMVLCCVGDLDPDEIAALAESILPAEAGEAPERDYGPAETPAPVNMRSELHTAVSAPLFYAGAKLLPSEEPGERFRRKLLGELALEYLAGPASALYTRLYADGLLGRSFGYEIDDEAGAMTLLLAGESRDPDAVLTALFESVNTVARTGVEEASFGRCLRARRGLELGTLDRFAAYAGALCRGAFGGWDPLETFALLDGFTAEDAAAFLCENLTEGRLAMSVVRP